MVNQGKMRGDDGEYFKVMASILNPSFCSFLVNMNPLSITVLYETQALKYRINLKINTPNSI